MTIPSAQTIIVTPGSENSRRKPKFSNKDRRDKPVPPERMLSQIRQRTGGWPKCIAGVLTCDEPAGIVYLNKDKEFIAWLHGKFDVNWGNGSITKAEFFEFCRQHCEKFDNLSLFPHFPPIDGLLYICRHDIRPTTGRLDQFLDFFSFASCVDREIAKSLLLTIFWGGPAGKRPMYLVEAEHGAPNRGIGAGKTTLIQKFSSLCGGFIASSQGEKVERLTTRILTPEPGSPHYRVVLYDNLKAHRLSWAEFESLITTDWISGRRLWVGGSRIPNHITFALTINGASLSGDLAKRCMPIRLSPAVYRQTWHKELDEFIEQYRWEIIAEIGQILTAPGFVLPDDGTSRWGPWEHGVLSRVNLPESVRAEFAVRQRELDDDAANAKEFLNLLRDPSRRTIEGTRSFAFSQERDGLLSCSQAEMQELLSVFVGKSIGANLVRKMIDHFGLPCLRQATDFNRRRRWLFRFDGEPITDEQVVAFEQRR